MTHSGDGAETVVALATLAERAGLDLVSFQDHPYQARFLDAWALDASTLISFVAARTSRIRLAANVLNLPLRQPAWRVPWRASTSWSSGRAELGIGAGAFWDAIEAMGGRRLSAGQSVDALEEGIDVIRLALGCRAAGESALRRLLLPPWRRPRGPGAAPRCGHPGRRLQAAHAQPDWTNGGRLAP